MKVLTIRQEICTGCLACEKPVPRPITKLTTATTHPSAS